MQQIPKNMPKAPSFDNVQDMLKWYRKNYRIPTFKNKVKRITKNVKGATTKGAGEYGRIFKQFPNDVKYSLNEFRKMMGLKTNKIPDSIMKEGIKGTKLRNYLLDQLDKSFDEALKTPAVRKSPQVLIPALSKAAGIFSMLVPSELDQENTMELPLPNNPFPAENAQIRQLQQQQPQEGSNPRAMYTYGGIVQPTAPKVKRTKRKTKKPTSWNY
tara:strand:- start:39 stop:680 length:642 start_codon:yes stop_codon:yes gene_type:complete